LCEGIEISSECRGSSVLYCRGRRLDNYHIYTEVNSAVSFLDKVRKLEEDKVKSNQDIQNRMPSWVQATTGLCDFIRRRLRGEDLTWPSPIEMNVSSVRIGSHEFEVLTIVYNNIKVEVKPMSPDRNEAHVSDRSDQFAAAKAGCVTILSSNGIEYRLFWNGASHKALDTWEIVKSSTRNPRFLPLTAENLDIALEKLFGLCV
jgi:hypothetical protein